MKQLWGTAGLFIAAMVTSTCTDNASKALTSPCASEIGRWNQLPGLATPGDAHLACIYVEGVAGYRRIQAGSLPRWDDLFKHILHDGVFEKDTLVIPARFEEATGFSEYTAAFREGAKWGLIDTSGAIQVQPTFDHIGELPSNHDNESFREGLAPALKNGQWGYIDHKGNWVIAASYAAAQKFHEGLAFVKRTKKDRWGTINCKGEWVAQTDFASVTPFFEGFAAVLTSRDGWGYADRQGDLLNIQDEAIQGGFEEAYAFSEGLAAVRFAPGTWGYLDQAGKVRHHDKVTYAQGYSCGLAAVEINGKWGYLDKEGNMAIQPKYLHANGFLELPNLGPCARVEDESGTHYIRNDGSTVLTGLE